MSKQGANGIVTFNGDRATKTLKKHTSQLGLQRFAIEVEALRRAQEAGVQNIVELISAELTASPPRFVMRKCDGDIDDLLDLTRNNPAAISRLTLPIVESLQQLATLPSPIFHRDIKPSNVLYKATNDNPSLVLADFGCAFLANSDHARLTEDMRAVGATFFRAPEYSHGRVENVTSSGDIFSIGKLLWYMCNGVNGEVFPYTLWFPTQYNLTVRCDARSVGLLNLLISSCVAHNPADRIGYEGLIVALKRLTEDPMPSANEPERLRIQTYEAELKVHQEETMSIFVQLITTLQSDLTWIADQISQLYQGTSLSASVGELTQFSCSAKELASVTVIQSSDHPITNWNTTHTRFHVRARPGNQSKNLNLPEISTPFIAIQVTNSRDPSHQMETMFVFHTTETGLMARTPQDDTVPYSRTKLMEYFKSSLERIGK